MEQPWVLVILLLPWQNTTNTAAENNINIFSYNSVAQKSGMYLAELKLRYWHDIPVPLSRGSREYCFLAYLGSFQNQIIILWL